MRFISFPLKDVETRIATGSTPIVERSVLYGCSVEDGYFNLPT